MRDDEGRSDQARQQGLEVHHSGEALEVMRSKSGESHLLASGAGFEMAQLTLKPDGELMLVPFESGAEGTEVYYVLSGEIEVRGSSSTKVGVGGYVVVDDLQEPAFISARNEAKMLYMSSQPTFPEMRDSMQSLMLLAVEVEEQDGYTAEHCRRLRRLSVDTARQLGLDPTRRYLLSYAAYLHDVGKSKVPAQILRKPGPLTEDEWKVMRMHTTYGRQLLEDTPWSEAGLIVEQHHERMDGSGYPRGLSGDEILTESYIVAVADMYDAMTTDRPYRKALPVEAAVEEIRKFSGVHYPEEVAQAFLKAIGEES